MKIAIPTANDLVIRQCETNEVTAVAELLEAAFQQFKPQYTPGAYAATVLDEPALLKRMSEGPVWVAVLDTTIIGTVSLLPRNDEIYLRGMAVHPGFRRKMVGEMMLSAAGKYAGKSGYKKLVLSTTPFLDAAISLYTKAGFKRSPKGPHHLYDTPLFTMSKTLIANI